MTSQLKDKFCDDAMQGYIRFFVNHLVKEGYNCVVLNARGTTEKLTTPR